MLIHSSKTYVAAVVAGMIVAMGAAVSCRRDGGGNNISPSDAVVRVGSKTLTIAELRRQIPGGLSKEDSAKYVRAYVASWVDTRLISEIAVDKVDREEIDRLVEDYRDELIMNAYRRKAAARGPVAVSEDSVKAFYAQHGSEYVLDRPMVRGVYLKVPDDAPKLPTLRRLYRSRSRNDIDRLEKEVLNAAIHYDYFRDRWVDWVQIESRIPHDFSSDAQLDFLRSKKNLEISSGGFTYLLDVSDYLPAGSPMPYEAAAAPIRERLLAEGRRKYDKALRKAIFDDALDAGKIEYFNSYGPTGGK